MSHRDNPISGNQEPTGNNFRSDHPRAENYGVGFIIGLCAPILFLLICFLLITCLCIRTIRIRQARNIKSKDEGAALDDAGLKVWLNIKYGEAIDLLPAGRDAASSCCSVCLADFVDDDELRLLRHCGHLFHTQCVDPWLQKQPTCPLCRSAVTPAA